MPAKAARTRIRMIGVKDKIRFPREGLFAKYVLALVGLVVFVLAVNGALETWINYRSTRTTLIDAMSEKAEATARRIEQSMSDLERQISWVTRASAVKLEDHRADYAQLLNQVPAVSQLSLLSGQGREQLRLSRTLITVGSNADLSRDSRFTEAVSRGVSYSPVHFRDGHPYMTIAMSHGYNAGVTLAEIDLRFLSDFLGDTQVGKTTFAYVVDPRGEVLANSTKGPEVGKDVSTLPQVASLLTPDGQALSSGADMQGYSVLTASSAVPKLGWDVFFEQPTAQALSPIRDQLLRVALLIALGLVVAILAGTLLARRMLIPITALRRGARRSATAISATASRCRPRTSWKNSPTSSTAWPGSCRRPIRSRNQGAGAHPRSRAVDQRTQGARGSRPRGRLLARPQRRAADGGGARPRNHPRRRGADLWL